MKKSKRICPKCKSHDIITDWSVENVARGFANPSFKCNNCGYVGTFFPEIEKIKIKKNQISK